MLIGVFLLTLTQAVSTIIRIPVTSECLDPDKLSSCSLRYGCTGEGGGRPLVLKSACSLSLILSLPA